MDRANRCSSAAPLVQPASWRGWRCALVCALLVGAASSSYATQPPDGLETLLAEGEAAVNAGNGKLALARFEAVLPLAEKSGDDGLLARALAGLGWGQWAAGQYEASLKSRARAVDLFRARADVRRTTVTLKGLGETYYAMGRYDDAIAQFELALESNRARPDPVQEGLILSNLGSTYRSQGKLDLAEETLQRATSVLRSTTDVGALGQVLTILGIVSRARGNYGEALAHYREAVEARRAAKDRRGEAQTLGNMANVHLDLGEYEQSIALNRQSLAIAEEIGYTVQVGFAHQNMGAALSNIPRAKEALNHYQLALETHRKIGRAAQVRWTLLNIGTLQAFLLGDPAAGRATLAEGLALARSGEDRQLAGYVLYELGSLDAAQGQLKPGLAQLDEALGIARELQMPDLEYKVLANRGLVLYRLGRAADAVSDLRASAAIVNDLRANVRSDQAKIAYVDTRQSVFHDLAIVLAGSGRPDEALEAAEAGRARALADLLGQRQVVGRPADREALEQVRASLAAASAPAGPAGATRGTADTLSASIRTLEGRSPELASLLTVSSADAAEIRATAARLRATLVEFLATKDALLIWVVTPEGRIHQTRHAVAAADLSARVTAIRGRLDAPTAEDLRAPAQLRTELRALHELLIAPIAKWLPEDPAQPVVIVPHGPTALVPFAALEDSSGRAMIDRHVLALAPSVSTFRYTAAKRRTDPWRDVSALVVADPVPPPGSGLERLPGTLDEGRRVSARLGRRADLLAGADAREAAVKKGMAGRRVIHFATHGLISEVRPVASSMVFGEGGGEDGYLRLDEIFGIEIQADLVVLSGCSTGLGRLTGDGMFGLTRGFIYAGTPSVVVSMWDVSDRATSLLMDRFYAALAAGVPRAQALAEAQRATRADYPHPSLWAAFVLVGEPR
jgi:CHAT domain-containing protein/tetratricopeptide (TPR) repeat protein